MSVQITTAMKQQYNANVTLLSQQKTSRLAPYVREEPVAGEFEYFDQVGTTSAQPRTDRHGDTPRMDTPHARRRVGMTPYNWADLIDKPDKVRTLIDPSSTYAMAAVAALNRAKDDVIIAAALGTSYTGKQGETAITFPASNIIAVGGAGLTIAKLLSVREALWKAEVDEDEELFFACGARQLTDLLNTTEVKSADYNTVKALAQGSIDSFLGFKFLRSERLPWAANVRKCIAWARNGILLGVGEQITTRISERDDKNYSVQVYAEMDLGATRMEESKVYEVDCAETIV